MLAQEGFIDQRTLARAGYPGDDRQDAGGNIHADILQVVDRGMDNRQPAGRLAEHIFERPGTQQMVASQRISFEQASKTTFVHDLTAFTSCIPSHIHRAPETRSISIDACVYTLVGRTS